jgi:hypothetical protein
MSAAAQTTNNGNGDKITLALIGQKLDALAAEQREVLSVLKDQGRELHRLDNEECIQAEKVDNLEKEVEKLRNRDTLWSGINTIFAAIATIIGLRN